MNAVFAADAEIGSDAVFAADAEIGSDAVFAADSGLGSDAVFAANTKFIFRRGECKHPKENIYIYI